MLLAVFSTALVVAVFAVLMAMSQDVAAALRGTGKDAAASVHVAKAVSSESYMGACDFAHEVHAGIGVMREYGLTLHTKMSRSLYHCLGAPGLHRKRLESALGLGGAPG